ncbi:MAG: ATP-binding protein [Methanoregula sp.]
MTDSPTRAISNPDDTLEAVIKKAKDAASKSSNVIYMGYEEEKKEQPALAPQGIDLQLACVPRKYQECSFDSFAGNYKLIEGLKGFSGDSVFLTGSTGGGKTHLAVALMRFINNPSSMFVTVPSLLMEIRDSFKSEAVDTETEIVGRYSGYDLLCLDDMGAEKSSVFSIATLYLILDKRAGDLKQTIVTSNLGLKEIEDALGARISSRLSEMKVTTINMPDYRKKR